MANELEPGLPENFSNIQFAETEHELPFPGAVRWS